MKKSLLLIILILFCISCKNKVEQKLIGLWTIDVIDAPRLSENLLTNMVSFKKDGTCLLPTTINDPIGKGTWMLNEKDSTITIKTDKNPLAGSYSFVFQKDEKNKLFKLILKSKDISLRCSKGLFNFDKDKNF